MMARSRYSHDTVWAINFPMAIVEIKPRLLIIHSLVLYKGEGGWAISRNLLRGRVYCK